MKNLLQQKRGLICLGLGFLLIFVAAATVV